MKKWLYAEIHTKIINGSKKEKYQGKYQKKMNQWNKQ